MTTTLNASTAGAGGFIATSDNSGVLALQTAGTTAITVDTNQMLGLGTTPSQTSGISMELGGSANNNAINFTNSANCQGWITSNAYYNGTNWLRKNASGTTCTAYATNVTGAHTWSYAASGSSGSTISWTEAMRIDSSGNLRIGTTTDNDTKIAVYWTQTGPTWGTKYLANNSGSTNFIEFRVNMGSSPSTVGSITYNGTTTLYNSTSDARLKKNIVDAPSSFSLINQIKIRSFDWKDSNTHVNYGVIAQEVFEVEPSCVGEGDTGDEIERTWGVDTSVLVPAMIKSIQELKAINDTQAETINALTARIVALEGK
jgi:hypothetical protein